MTEPEFDALLRQALRTGIHEDFDAAWTSDGPVPPRSEKHQAWEESFLADPFAAVERKEQKARRWYYFRRTGRIAVAAALVVLITLGAAIALVPKLAKYRDVTTQKVTLIRSGKTVQYFYYEFQLSSFSSDTPQNATEAENASQHWYPQWLPKLPNGLFYQIVTDDPSDGQLEYEVHSADPSKREYIYGDILLSYAPMEETYTFVVGLYENYTHRLEETSVNGHPGFFLFTEPTDTTESERETIPTDLIWFDFDAQTVFELCGYNQTSGCTTSQLTNIAKSVQAGKIYP